MCCLTKLTVRCRLRCLKQQKGLAWVCVTHLISSFFPISPETLNQKSRTMASFARRAMNLAQIQSARVPASACQRRGLAGAAGTFLLFSSDICLDLMIAFVISFHHLITPLDRGEMFD